MQDRVVVRMHEALTPSQLNERLQSLTADGRPFALLEYEFQGDPRYDSRYTSDFASLMAAAFTLAAVGMSGADIVREESGRFRIRHNGGQATLAIAFVISDASAQYNDSIGALNAELNRIIATDEEVQTKLHGAIAELVLPSIPLRSDRQELLKELRSVMLHEDLRSEQTTIEPINKRYRLLSSLDSQIIKTKGGEEFSHFSVRPPARSVGPYNMVALAIQKLQKARAESPETPAHLPRWLALYFAEPMTMPETNLRHLASSPPTTIEPFKRVFVGDQRQMLEYCETLA